MTRVLTQSEARLLAKQSAKFSSVQRAQFALRVILARLSSSTIDGADSLANLVRGWINADAGYAVAVFNAIADRFEDSEMIRHLDAMRGRHSFGKVAHDVLRDLMTGNLASGRKAA